MFIKLLKTDLKQQIRIIPWVYACALAFALLYMGLQLLEGNALASILSGLFLAGSLCTAGLALFYGMLRCWQMLHRQLFMEEAHLYRTLPVTCKQLLGACLGSGLLILMLSLAVLVLCLMIACWSPTDQMSAVSLLFDAFQAEFGTQALWLMGLAALAQSSFILCCGLFGVIMGKGKLAASVLWGLGIYYGVVLLVLLVVLLLGRLSVVDLSQESIDSFSLYGILWSACIMYFTLDALLMGFCQYRVGQGLDVL